jgi:hypothetical protein
MKSFIMDIFLLRISFIFVQKTIYIICLEEKLCQITLALLHAQ